MKLNCFPKQSCRHGFTVTELLLSIGVIAILASLLYPTLQNARQGSLSAKCLGNLKQLGVAGQLYSNDHDGQVVPMNRDYSGAPNALWWPNLLDEYAPVPQWLDKGWGNAVGGIYQCPAVPGEDKIWWGGGYGMNEQNLSKYGSTLKYAGLSRLSKLLLFADAHVPSHSDGPSTVVGIFDPINSPWSSGCNQASPRHGGKSNVCFADGHAETVDWKDLEQNKNDIFGHDLQ